MSLLSGLLNAIAYHTVESQGIPSWCHRHVDLQMGIHLLSHCAWPKDRLDTTKEEAQTLTSIVCRLMWTPTSMWSFLMKAAEQSSAVCLGMKLR